MNSAAQKAWIVSAIIFAVVVYFWLTKAPEATNKSLRGREAEQNASTALKASVSPMETTSATPTIPKGAMVPPTSTSEQTRPPAPGDTRVPIPSTGMRGVRRHGSSFPRPNSQRQGTTGQRQESAGRAASPWRLNRRSAPQRYRPPVSARQTEAHEWRQTEINVSESQITENLNVQMIARQEAARRLREADQAEYRRRRISWEAESRRREAEYLTAIERHRRDVERQRARYRACLAGERSACPPR